MSTKIFATHRETGEKWVPLEEDGVTQYLVLSDQGFLLVVTDDPYMYSTSIKRLDGKIWKTEFTPSLISQIKRYFTKKGIDI